LRGLQAATRRGIIGRHLHVTARQVAFVLATLTAEESARLPRFRVVAAGGVNPTSLWRLLQKY